MYFFAGSQCCKKKLNTAVVVGAGNKYFRVICGHREYGSRFISQQSVAYWEWGHVDNILCSQKKRCFFSLNDTSTELVEMCRIKVWSQMIFTVYFCVRILDIGQQQGFWANSMTLVAVFKQVGTAPLWEWDVQMSVITSPSWLSHVRST